MTDIAELRQRVLRSRERLHAIPYLGNGEPGPPDPETGERWNRGHVLGHLGDVLRFWPVQVRAVLAGAAWVGRGEDGYADRRRAIESGPERDERALREEIDAGIDDLLRLLRRPAAPTWVAWWSTAEPARPGRRPWEASSSKCWLRISRATSDSSRS